MSNRAFLKSDRKAALPLFEASNFVPVSWLPLLWSNSVKLSQETAIEIPIFQAATWVNESVDGLSKNFRSIKGFPKYVDAFVKQLEKQCRANLIADVVQLGRLDTDLLERIQKAISAGDCGMTLTIPGGKSVVHPATRELVVVPDKIFSSTAEVIFTSVEFSEENSIRHGSRT